LRVTAMKTTARFARVAHRIDRTIRAALVGRLPRAIAVRCLPLPKNEYLVEKSADLFASWSQFAKSHGEAAGTQATFNEKLRFRGFEPKEIKQLNTKGCRDRLKYQTNWQE
jgi:hypothetical protein